MDESRPSVVSSIPALPVSSISRLLSGSFYDKPALRDLAGRMRGFRTGEEGPAASRFQNTMPRRSQGDSGIRS
jgi:hypothetical protein